MPSPLRRSDKDDKNHSPSVSGNSEKGSNSLENRNNEEQGGMKGCPTKKGSAPMYMATLLKTQGKKDKSDKKLKVPQGVSLEKGAGCSLKVGHGIKVEEVRGKLPSYLNTVELSVKVGSKRIKPEMSASSAPREICASTADVVLTEVCVPAPVVSVQNGEMSESCIQMNGSEHAVHRKSKDNTETSREGQRKPAETENLVHLKLEEDGGKHKARVCRELSEECCTDVQLREAPLMKKAGSGDNDDVPKKRRKLDDITVDAASDRSGVEDKRKIGGANKEVTVPFSKEISLVNKICAKRWVKLVAYQTKESYKFKEERDKIEKEQIAALEKAHKFESALVRSLHKQSSVGVEKLKIADQNFQKRKDVIKNHMDSEQKRLELLHEEARNKEKDLKNHWSLEAKSGRPVGSFSTLPQSLCSYFKLETMQLNEHDPSKEPITDRTGSPRFSEMGVTSASETVRGESAISIECPENFVQSTEPPPSMQSNGGTSVLQLDVQIQLELEGLELSEQGPQEDPALDRTGSLGDSVMGDAGPSEDFRGQGTIPTEPLDNVSTCQSTDPLPYKQSNDGSSVPSVQFHLRDSERSEQGPSEEPVTDRTGSLRLAEMGVGGSSETVPGHEPVVMGTPINPSENLVESTGSLGPNEARVPEVSGTIHGHEQVMGGVLPTEQLPMSAPGNLPSEPLSSNSSSHDTSVLSPAINLELPTPMDSLPSEQSRMPTGPSVGNSTRVSDTRSMTSFRTPQDPLPQDPLCYELARIRKEKEQVAKSHDELKMRINLDYEKEKEEIEQKYSKLRHDVDTAFAEKQKAYHASSSKVSMNMMLAEAFRLKCSESTRAAGPLASQQAGGHPGPLHNHQSFHSPSHQNSQRSPLVSSAAISATPSTTVQQVTRHSSAPFYNNNMLVRPHFSSGGASMSASYQVGCRQSHAPHLQPFTPSTSMSSSPSQQPPYNSTTLPIPQLNNPAGVSSSCLQLTGLPVNHGVGANSSLVIDSVMNDFDNFGLLSSVGSGSSNNNLLPPVQTLDLSDLPGGLNDSDLRGPATASSAGEVVCLSDDE